MSLEKIIACFKELGFKPRIDDFEDRLKIQKTVFLLEQKGIKLGFEFNLYARGPYSPDLTREVYKQTQKIEALETSESLSSSETKKLEEFKELFAGLQPSILEVAATYSFFAFKRGQDPITALTNVKKIKQFYPEKQIALGISKAKEFLFKPSEKEISELKKELGDWQQSSINSMRG